MLNELLFTNKNPAKLKVDILKNFLLQSIFKAVA